MRIKELLKEKHYTQQELADKMNVSLSAVRQMVAAESLTTATLEKSPLPSTSPCGSYSRPRKKCSFLKRSFYQMPTLRKRVPS